MTPIDGMTTEPLGLPLMMPAWLGCLQWAAGNEELIEQFKRDTGHMLTPSTGINRMIDQATGYDKAVFIEWCDWVTKNIWGEEGSDADGT